MKIFIAQTIDGYIAGPDGSLDYLKPFEGNDYGFEAFIGGTDAMVVGRNTFDAIWPDHGWPHPAHLPGIILTSRALPDTVPAQVAARTDIDSIAVEFPNAYVDGGETIRQFLAARHIKEARIFTLPVLLGGGIRLFEKPLGEPQNWRLLDTFSYPCGTVLTHYQL